MSKYNSYKEFEDAVIAQYKKDMGLNGVRLLRATLTGAIGAMFSPVGAVGAAMPTLNFSLSAYREVLKKEYEHRFNEVKNDPIKTESLFTKALNTLKSIH